MKKLSFFHTPFFRKKSFIITFVQPMRKILMGFFILKSSLDIVANI